MTEHLPPEEQSTVAKDVLRRIETEAITPTPRWQFLLKNGVLWGAFALSSFIGMLAVAAALFALAHSGFRFYLATHDTVFTFLFDTLPLVWLLTIGAVIALSNYQVRHTKRGYRYPLWLLVLVSIGISGIGGVVLNAIGVGKIVDQEVGMRIPLHRPVVLMQQELWVQPERGLLAGEVTGSSSADSIVLRDFNGTEWRIVTMDLRRPDRMTLEKTAYVRVVGVPITESGTSSAFHACFLFPWDLPPRPERPPFNKLWGDAKVPTDDRSERCRGMRPYNHLRSLQEQSER